MKLNALLLLLFMYAFLTDVSARPSSSSSVLASSSSEEDTGILSKVKELPSLLSWIPIGSQRNSQTSTTPAPTVATTSQPDSAPIGENIQQMASIIKNAPWWFLGSTDHQETTSPTPEKTPILSSKTSDTKPRDDSTSVTNVLTPLKNVLPIYKRVSQPMGTTDRLKLPDLWISSTPQPDYQASDLWSGAAESVRNILNILPSVEEISTPSPVRTTTERLSRPTIVPLQIGKSRQPKTEPTLAFSGVSGKLLSQTDLSSSAAKSPSDFPNNVPVEDSFSTLDPEQFETASHKSTISPATPMPPIGNTIEKSTNASPQLSLPNKSIPEIPSLPRHHSTDVAENEKTSSSHILPSTTANSDSDLTVPVNKITDRESPENMNSLEQNNDSQPLIQPSVLQEQSVPIRKEGVSRSPLVMGRPQPETENISSPNNPDANGSDQLSGIDKNSRTSGPEESTITSTTTPESEDRIESSTSSPEQTVNVVGGSPRSGGKSRSLGSMPPKDVEDSPLIEHEEPNENSKSSSTFDYGEAAVPQEPEDNSTPSIPIRTSGASRSAIHPMPLEHIPPDKDSSHSLFTSDADDGAVMQEPEGMSAPIMPPRSAGASRSAIHPMPLEHIPPDKDSSHSLFTSDADDGAVMQEPEGMSAPIMPPRSAGASRSAIHAMPQTHISPDIDLSHSLSTSDADDGAVMQEPEGMSAPIIPARSAGASRSAIHAMPQEHIPHDIDSSHLEAHPQIETPEILEHTIKHHSVDHPTKQHILDHPTKHHTVEHPTKHHIVHHHDKQHILHHHDKHHILHHHNKHSVILHGHHVKEHTHCAKSDLHKMHHSHHSVHRTPQVHPIETPYTEILVSLQLDSSLNAQPNTILLPLLIPTPILPPLSFFVNN